MGEAVFESESSFAAEGHGAAAVLCRTEHGNLHAGLLHRTSDGVAVLHLGWEDYLCYDWAWDRLWAVPEVEPERLTPVAGLCRRIWKLYQSEKRFPYALAYCGSTFDASGRLQLGEGAIGLTCATFILAVLNAVGLSLVDEDDWPVRTEEDLAFLKTLEAFAQPDHLQRLRDEVAAKCKRIHPHEVMGACAVEPLPAPYAPTSEVAARVVVKLDGTGGEDGGNGETLPTTPDSAAK